MSASVLAARLGISRNHVYSSVWSGRAGTISLNQFEKMADTMCGKLI